MLDNLENLSAKKIFDSFPVCIHKKFGQNFLFDEKINSRIVSAAGNLAGKVVVEVGPGPGGLTIEILKHDIDKLYIIEIDTHWSAVWKKLSNIFNGKLEVIEGDALKFDFKTISPSVIISNLPYNISTRLLFKWLKESNNCENLILTFQKEVAERLCAFPYSKEYGKLSILAQCKSRIVKVLDLEPGSFFPAPKVKSKVIKITPYPHDRLFDNFDLFSNLLTDVFSCRRKTIVKSLSHFFRNPDEILLELGYSNKARPEEITVDDYVKILYKAAFMHGKT